MSGNPIQLITPPDSYLSHNHLNNIQDITQSNLGDISFLLYGEYFLIKGFNLERYNSSGADYIYYIGEGELVIPYLNTYFTIKSPAKTLIIPDNKKSVVILKLKVEELSNFLSSQFISNPISITSNPVLDMKTDLLVRGLEDDITKDNDGYPLLFINTISSLPIIKYFNKPVEEFAFTASIETKRIESELSKIFYEIEGNFIVEGLQVSALNSSSIYVNEGIVYIEGERIVIPPIIVRDINLSPQIDYCVYIDKLGRVLIKGKSEQQSNSSIIALATISYEDGNYYTFNFKNRLPSVTERNKLVSSFTSLSLEIEKVLLELSNYTSINLSGAFVEKFFNEDNSDIYHPEYLCRIDGINNRLMPGGLKSTYNYSNLNVISSTFNNRVTRSDNRYLIANFVEKILVSQTNINTTVITSVGPYMDTVRILQNTSTPVTSITKIGSQQLTKTSINNYLKPQVYIAKASTKWLDSLNNTLERETIYTIVILGLSPLESYSLKINNNTISALTIISDNSAITNSSFRGSNNGVTIINFNYLERGFNIIDTDDNARESYNAIKRLLDTSEQSKEELFFLEEHYLEIVSATTSNTVTDRINTLILDSGAEDNYQTNSNYLDYFSTIAQTFRLDYRSFVMSIDLFVSITSSQASISNTNVPVAIISIVEVVNETITNKVITASLLYLYEIQISNSTKVPTTVLLDPPVILNPNVTYAITYTPLVSGIDLYIHSFAPPAQIKDTKIINTKKAKTFKNRLINNRRSRTPIQETTATTPVTPISSSTNDYINGAVFYRAGQGVEWGRATYADLAFVIKGAQFQDRESEITFSITNPLSNFNLLDFNILNRNIRLNPNLRFLYSLTNTNSLWKEFDSSVPLEPSTNTLYFKIKSQNSPTDSALIDVDNLFITTYSVKQNSSWISKTIDLKKNYDTVSLSFTYFLPTGAEIRVYISSNNGQSWELLTDSDYGWRDIAGLLDGNIPLFKQRYNQTFNPLVSQVGLNGERTEIYRRTIKIKIVFNLQSVSYLPYIKDLFVSTNQLTL